MDFKTFLLVMEIAPGILALIGVAAGFGQLKQRLIEVEKDVAKVGDLSDKVTRIDERTLSTDRKVGEMQGGIDRLVQHLLDDPVRSFNRDHRRT